MGSEGTPRRVGSGVGSRSGICGVPSERGDLPGMVPRVAPRADMRCPVGTNHRPNGAGHTSPGQRPGYGNALGMRRITYMGSEGTPRRVGSGAGSRSGICSVPSERGDLPGMVPRVAPRADMRCPVGTNHRPNGAGHTSPGQRPGYGNALGMRRITYMGSEGTPRRVGSGAGSRSGICSVPSERGDLPGMVPRVAPRADMRCPVGTNHRPNGAATYQPRVQP
ncbi:MAG: hypothetical protein LVT47_15850 [Cyanobacteria bacterium LVE1205-1]|jgi:hypothetical protein